MVQRVALIGDLHYFTPEFSREKSITQSQIDDFYRQYIQMVKRELHVEAAISVGDLTHRGERHEYDGISSLFSEQDIALSHVMGNHDVLMHTIPELGELPFHRHNEIRENGIGTFVFIDTPYEQNGDQNWGGDITEEQIELIVGSRNKTTSAPVFVISHHPIYDTTEGSTGKWMSIPKDRNLGRMYLPSNRPSVFISGHVHTTDYKKKNGWICIQLPSVFASKHLFVVESEHDTSRIRAKPIRDNGWLETAALYGAALVGHTYVTDDPDQIDYEVIIK